MMRGALKVWLAIGGLLVGAAQAQVEINWSLANNRTVLMEPVLATVQISNNTGQDLDLTPRGNARLRFSVEDQPSSTVPDTGQPLLPQAVIIPAGEIRDVEVNLLDAYRIVKGQSYMLTPMIEFAGMQFTGERRSLEVQPGIELLKREFGMPNTEDARSVSLRLINRDRNDRLFFRMDKSATGFCLGVYDLGRVIRFFKPCLEQDREGAFHVLHQNGPDRFVHSVFSYDGVPQETTFYAAQTGSIKLVRNESGGLEVQGGLLYTEDPEHPGVLTAPALPPSHPYRTTLGDEPAAAPAPAPAPKASRKTADKPTQTEKSHAGSDTISW